MWDYVGPSGPINIWLYATPWNLLHRYVTTQVRLVIQNTVQVNQTYMFGYVMAKSALVSNVTLVNNHGDTVKSSVDARYGHRHSFFVHLSLSFWNNGANNHQMRGLPIIHKRWLGLHQTNFGHELPKWAHFCPGAFPVFHTPNIM